MLHGLWESEEKRLRSDAAQVKAGRQENKVKVTDRRGRAREKERCQKVRVKSKG